METAKPNLKILKMLLKNFSVNHTVTSIAKEFGITRVGAWKILKKLEAENMIILSPLGKGRTSTYNISLNWDNPIVEKTLSLILTEDAIKNQRWMDNFAELKNKTDFLIIYGSIILSPKEANDIDILGITSKNNFIKIEETLKKIQKTQIKKIHILNFTEAEFKQELKKLNKAFIDAIKKGIVLFGQEKFIKFMRNIKI